MFLLGALRWRILNLEEIGTRPGRKIVDQECFRGVALENFDPGGNRNVPGMKTCCKDLGHQVERR